MPHTHGGRSAPPCTTKFRRMHHALHAACCGSCMLGAAVYHHDSTAWALLISPGLLFPLWLAGGCAHG